MMRIATLLCFLLYATAAAAQVDTVPERVKIYKAKPQYELPFGAACIFASSAGFTQLDKISHMTEAQILKLDPYKVNSFDRSIAFIDPKGFAKAQSNSDFFLNVSLFTPIILALDKKVRKDWLDLAGIFLMSHTVDNLLYFGGTFPFRRARPLVYNPKVPLSDKFGGGKSNSFFSGHVSFAATSTFFTAKVYTDYHNIRGWKRLPYYAIAAIPPAMVGYFRMRAGKHFKTDVITGFIAGAASGIFVPELHRFKKKLKNVSFYPFFTPGSTGMTATLNL